MATERTLSIIKPDATRRNLTGKINAKFEEAGLRIVAQKRLQLTQAQAEAAGFEVGRCAMGDWPRDVDVVVSTVPEGVAAAAATLPAGGRLMLDVVYADGPSALARAAERHGYAVVPGTAMLLHQATEQFLLITGHAAPVEAMRSALDEALAARAAGSAP